jgi:hypothetical protein
MSAYAAHVGIRQHTRESATLCPRCPCASQHTSAYVSIRQHTSAYGPVFVALALTTDIVHIAERSEKPAERVVVLTCIHHHTSGYVRIRQDTSGYVRMRSIRQQTSAYVRIRQHSTRYGYGTNTLRILTLIHSTARAHDVTNACENAPAHVHVPAYVSIRQHSSTYVSIRQHTSAYVSIRT